MDDTNQSDKNQKMVLKSIAKWLVIFALIAFVCYKNQDLMQEALDNSCMETGYVSAARKSVFHRGRLYHQRNDEHLRPSFICMAGNHLCIPVYIFPDCNTWKRNRSRTALLL